ncbi:sugar-binding transcriptional regulator [Lichenicoccus roseus]|uniref:Sugar-binding transcriptional regulator n=1 Tax=Lichenicoccus roseus TaxID=2683649 RepID=A0A5R9IZN8_9PROT|nr:sugar-binding transcriptional regulator [Lichenicoccus roseus]TLU70940.1 sugar-binding transcriptional regulator [Lichenicoccus roseus]
MPVRPDSDDVDLRSLSTEGREVLMLQAAKGYYNLDRTMADIAKQLGLTRWQVARLLKDAREQGVVRIEIIPRAQRRPELETRLQRAYGLIEAIVVPGEGDDDGLAVDSVAQAAGQFLAALTPRPPLVGVSWGRTMASVAHWLPRRWNDGVEVVLLNGAMNVHATATRTNNIAELFAVAGNGRATLLPVPAMVGRSETRMVLERDPVIETVLALGEQAPVVCLGLGSMTPESVLVRSGYIAESEIARLRKAGAVGDVLGRFIDADARIVDAELDARTIGLSPAALRGKAISIGVAVGLRKHLVVQAALKARLINVLVTDEQTALAALEAARGA